MPDIVYIDFFGLVDGVARFGYGGHPNLDNATLANTTPSYCHGKCWKPFSTAQNFLVLSPTHPILSQTFSILCGRSAIKPSNMDEKGQMDNKFHG